MNRSRPGPASRTVFSLSETETMELGRTLGQGLAGGELILLEGELGLGKTVFARGIAEGLGIAPEEVTSPSFTLVNEYGGGRLLMYHLDLYRIERPDETGTLGLEELLASGGVVVVEWGERLDPRYQRDALVVRFHDIGEGSRRIDLFSAGWEGAEPRGDA
jgi:tRNA threonylcarbamoyladenosine biosynthesis protein TsaE